MMTRVNEMIAEENRDTTPQSRRPTANKIPHAPNRDIAYRINKVRPADGLRAYQWALGAYYKTSPIYIVVDQHRLNLFDVYPPRGLSNKDDEDLCEALDVYAHVMNGGSGASPVRSRATLPMELTNA